MVFMLPGTRYDKADKTIIVQHEHQSVTRKGGG